MYKYIGVILQDIINNPISLLALIVSIVALYKNQKNGKLNSYNQKGCFYVSLLRKNLLQRLIKNYDITVKINNSIRSDSIPFNNRFIVGSYVGGISRAQIFSTYDDEQSISINKTHPEILNNRKAFKLSKKYANSNMYTFLSSPIFPYFSALGKYDEDRGVFERQLSRYHFYIELTDYCNNTEIWYVSFSLLLSNLEEDLKTKKWKKCIYSDFYKYYTFDDINIVSPKDIPKNLNRANMFNKTLKQIENKPKDKFESMVLIEQGFDAINNDLSLYEMKMYIKFIKQLGYDYLK